MSKSHQGGTHVSGRSGRAMAAPMSVDRIAMVLLGLVILVFAIPPFFNFPRVDFWLVPLAVIYFLLLYLLPRLWLIVLPVVTVCFDLSTWTGRFAYNELDLVFLVTLASGLVFGRYRFSVFSVSRSSIVLLLYVVVLALGYAAWTFFILPPAQIQENPYYTSEYAYKVIKGVVWGLGLVPMWGYLLAKDKWRATTRLVAGMSLAAVVLGLIVLWERGTLGVLLAGSAWYHMVSSLLDLSASYRVTGVFSDMHTGGEAIDGVILLLLPATLYGAVYGRATWLRLVGVAGFLALAYVTLVGFTRATYAAFFLALIMFAFLALRARRNSGLLLELPVALFCYGLLGGVVAGVIAFRFAGSYGLASYAALLLVAYAGSRVKVPGWARYGPLVIVLILVALAARAHFDSVWVEPSYFFAALIMLSLGASYLLWVKLFLAATNTTEVNRLFLLGGGLVLPAVLAFALGGSQINERATHVFDDFKTRQNHWRDVVASADDGILAAIFGNGAGSFPGRYIAAHPSSVQSVGSFDIGLEENRAILRMGGGHDLTIGQRIAIEPFIDYTVNVHLRADHTANLTIALCERNLIYASNFMPKCVRENIRFDDTEGRFEKYTLTINSDQVGARSALRRWPTVMTLQYGKSGSMLEVAGIELLPGDFNQLYNSAFGQGLDYWFFYNDFAHLPWHVKNTFLQVWFESGWLGLVLFLILLGFLIRTNFERRSYDSLTPVYTTAVIILCVFGLFGSPLDSARVSWMFYFFLGAGLATLKVKRRQGGGAQATIDSPRVATAEGRARDARDRRGLEPV